MIETEDAEKLSTSADRRSSLLITLRDARSVWAQIALLCPNRPKPPANRGNRRGSLKRRANGSLAQPCGKPPLDRLPRSRLTSRRSAVRSRHRRSVARSDARTRPKLAAREAAASRGDRATAPDLAVHPSSRPCHENATSPARTHRTGDVEHRRESA